MKASCFGWGAQMHSLIFSTLPIETQQSSRLLGVGPLGCLVLEGPDLLIGEGPDLPRLEEDSPVEGMLNRFPCHEVRQAAPFGRLEPEGRVELQHQSRRIGGTSTGVA